MFQNRGKHVLTGATINGKNMLPMGSIFFTLKVDCMMIDNNRQNLTVLIYQSIIIPWENSGKVLDSRPRGRGLEPHRRHCVVSLTKNSNPSLVLVQPRKIYPFITEGC